MTAHLKRRREELGLTQTELAGLAVTSQQQIDRLEKGERRLTRDWAVRLARPLRWSPMQVMFGDAGANAIQLLGEMTPDETVLAYSPEAIVRIEAPPDDAIDLQAVRVASDAFEPRFFADDLLLVSAAGADLADCIGRECLVELSDGRLMIKRVEAGRSPETVTLRAYRLSNETLVDVSLRWASPIRWIKPRGTPPAA